MWDEWEGRKGEYGGEGKGILSYGAFFFCLSLLATSLFLTCHIATSSLVGTRLSHRDCARDVGGEATFGKGGGRLG